MTFANSARDRDIVRLALPALGALAAEPTYLLVDTAVVGHLGTVQLAALGLAATFLASIFWLFNFLANATTTHVANAHGSGNEDQVGSITAQAVWLAIAIGLTLTVLGVALAEPITGLLQAHGAVADHATTYIRISALGAPFVMIALAGQGWARGTQRMNVPLKILVASNIVNLLLEVLFIYGFEWGIAGSAWGTVIAQVGAAVAFVWTMRDVLAGHLKIVRERMRALISVGGDLFIRTGLMLLCFNGINALLARVGATDLAANQVLFQLMIFLALVMDSIAIAGQTLIGRELGAAARESAQSYAMRVTVLSFYAGAVLALLLAAGHDLLPQAFTSDAAVLDQIGNVWWLFVVYVLFSSLVYGWDGVMLGGGDSRVMMFVMLAATSACLPVAYLLIDAPHAIVGAWIAFSVLNFVRLIGNGTRVLSGRWSQNSASRH
ncbi:MAG: MATE family efflux transporter [Thermoleophilaceae bacterium]|nr:MATE family efflux transporter [Thermoleophilaceae bacterium]